MSARSQRLRATHRTQGDVRVEPGQVLADLAPDRGRSLVAYATVLTGDRAAAQDLVQDVMVKVFGGCGPGSPSRRQRPTRRTILSLYIDGYRRRRLWHRAAPLLAEQGAGIDPGAAADSVPVLATDQEGQR